MFSGKQADVDPSGMKGGRKNEIPAAHRGSSHVSGIFETLLVRPVFADGILDVVNRDPKLVMRIEKTPLGNKFGGG